MSSRPATFYMERRGNLQFAGQMQRKLYDAYVSGLPEGQIVQVTIRKARHDKTQPQLGYWYGVLMPFACDVLREAGYDELFEVAIGDLKAGVQTTPVTCDLLFKTLYGASVQAGGPVQKRTMTDEEMGQLIDFTATWLAKNLGAIAPQPEN